jgi:Zn-dependent oligopeptidase
MKEFFRNERSKLLGYKNHAEFSLRTKSAVKPENVTDLLEA